MLWIMLQILDLKRTHYSEQPMCNINDLVFNRNPWVDPQKVFHISGQITEIIFLFFQHNTNM